MGVRKLIIKRINGYVLKSDDIPMENNTIYFPFDVRYKDCDITIEFYLEDKTIMIERLPMSTLAMVSSYTNHKFNTKTLDVIECSKIVDYLHEIAKNIMQIYKIMGINIDRYEIKFLEGPRL